MVTKGDDLPVDYVIHAVGLVYNEMYDKSLKIRQLESCLVNILEMANIIGAESVSIPAISTGINSFPNEFCASIMIDKSA